MDNRQLELSEESMSLTSHKSNEQKAPSDCQD